MPNRLQLDSLYEPDVNKRIIKLFVDELFNQIIEEVEEEENKNPDLSIGATGTATASRRRPVGEMF
jgi:hypothetical protein